MSPHKNGQAEIGGQTPWRPGCIADRKNAQKGGGLTTALSEVYISKRRQPVNPLIRPSASAHAHVPHAGIGIVFPHLGHMRDPLLVHPGLQCGQLALENCGFLDIGIPLGEFGFQFKPFRVDLPSQLIGIPEKGEALLLKPRNLFLAEVLVVIAHSPMGAVLVPAIVPPHLPMRTVSCAPLGKGVCARSHDGDCRYGQDHFLEIYFLHLFFLHLINVCPFVDQRLVEKFKQHVACHVVDKTMDNF